MTAQALRFFARFREMAFHFGETLLGFFVFFFGERAFFDVEAHLFALHPSKFLRKRVDLHAESGGGFVDQVHGFVRQEAVGDIARREFHGRDNGVVGDAHAAMQFIYL